MSKSFSYIDLFAGAGGLSEGFSRVGFTPVAHVEMDTAACYTLKTRTAYHYLKSNGQYDSYVGYLKGEVSRTELYSLIPEKLLNSVINLSISPDTNHNIHERIYRNLKNKPVDLIIGGPPCQAYSLVGRARSKNKMEGDSRNYLFVQYAEYLEKYQPRMFVFENVLGLKSAKKGYYLNEMESLFSKRGYNTKLFTLEARNFGVLQNRRRVIILGWKKSEKLDIPNLEEIRIENNFLVNDLLKDLPEIKAGEGRDKFLNYKSPTTEYLETNSLRNGIDVLTQHIARPHREQDKEIYRIAVEEWNNNQGRLNYNNLPERLQTHQNRTSFVDRFKVVAGNLPYSQTVVAHISKDGHYYIHPDITQNRSISIREAARLQSFPDDYYFEGEKENANRTAAFKQIGNAVPPLMAKVIADEVMKTLDK